MLLSSINKLRYWDSNKTTFVLGVRDLSLTYPRMYGEDVKQLLDLILVQEIDVFPHKSVVESIDGKPVFNEDFDQAIKMLQAYYSLPVTGIVDEVTLTSLKLYAKW